MAESFLNSPYIRLSKYTHGPITNTWYNLGLDEQDTFFLHPSVADPPPPPRPLFLPYTGITCVAPPFDYT